MATLNHTSRRFALNSGAEIPAIGLGTWKSPPDQVCRAVCGALQLGYRHVDTALNYQNETEFGQGIRDSGVPRDQIWVTTKLDNHWHHRVREGFEKSLSDLGLDYIDLYLVHFPCSTRPQDRSKHLPEWDFVKTWSVVSIDSLEGLSVNLTNKARNANLLETVKSGTLARPTFRFLT